MLKAMLIPLGEKPKVIDISKTDICKEFHNLVGGTFDMIDWAFTDQNIDLVINDEGKFTCSPNRAIYSDKEGIGWDNKPIHKGDVLDIIFGDFIAIGFDPETGDSRSLTDDEIKLVRDRFGENTILSGYLEALKIKSRA